MGFRYKRKQKIGATKRSSQSYVVRPDRSMHHLAQAAAMHEAGHIVAAFALGFKVVYSTLDVRPGTAGHRIGGYTETALALGLPPDRSEAELRAAALTPDVLRVRAMQVHAGSVAEGWVNQDSADVDAGSELDDRTMFGYAVLALGGGLDGTNMPPTPTITDWMDARGQETVDLLAPLSSVVVDVANYLIE